MICQFCYNPPQLTYIYSTSEIKDYFCQTCGYGMQSDNNRIYHIFWRRTINNQEYQIQIFYNDKNEETYISRLNKDRLYITIMRTDYPMNITPQNIIDKLFNIITLN